MVNHTTHMRKVLTRISQKTPKKFAQKKVKIPRQMVQKLLWKTNKIIPKEKRKVKKMYLTDTHPRKTIFYEPFL